VAGERFGSVIGLPLLAVRRLDARTAPTGAPPPVGEH
jgi:hypothetical protein